MADSTDIAVELIRERGGVLRTAEILELGIHPRTLYRMRDEGVIEELSRGVYRLADLPPLEHADLVAVSLRAPHGVICLLSALAFHEATTEIPHDVHLAIQRGTSPPRIEYPPTRTFKFSGTMFEAGVDVRRLDGVAIRMYDLPKTVVDCFRLRNRIGIDVAVEALSLALAEKGVRVSQILPYARICRVERVMMPYLEALQ